MTKRDFALDVISEIVKEFGSNVLNNRKDIYRSRKMITPMARISDDDDNQLVISKVIISEFHNGIIQFAYEISDLNWKSFSSCTDKDIINVAYRLCKKYLLTDKLLELCNFCGYAFMEEEES